MAACANMFNYRSGRRGAVVTPSATPNQLGEIMQRHQTPREKASHLQRSGKIKYGIFAWLLGLPLPIIILALFFRGCDF